MDSFAFSESSLFHKLKTYVAFMNLRWYFYDWEYLLQLKSHNQLCVDSL